MKRKWALALLGVAVVLAGAALLLVRTAWVGERLCAIAAARVHAATGLPLSVGACRVEPFRLELRAAQVRLGPAGAPVFTADEVRARLAPVQALGKRLELAELTVTRPRLAAALPAAAGGGGACPPPLLEQFQIHRLRVDEGTLALQLPGGGRLTVDRVDVRSGPPQHRRGVRGLVAPGARRAGLEVTLAGTRLEAGGRRWVADAVHARADLALDLSRLDLHELTGAFPGGVSVGVSGAVDRLCQPRLDLEVQGGGPLPALLALAGRPGPPARGRVDALVTVTGSPAAPAAEARVRLSGVAVDGWRPGDAVAHLRYSGRELEVRSLEVPAASGGGRLTARGRLRFGREVALEAEGQLSGFDLGELLGRLQIEGAWVMGRLDGHLKVSGTAAPLRLDGRADLDLGDFRVLDHAWERWRPGEPAVLDLRRARVEGPIRVDRQGVQLEGVQVRAARGAVRVHGLLGFSDARGFQLDVDGLVDLTDLRHLATVPIGGLAEVEGVQLRAAPYGPPAIAGRVKARELRFLQLDLGEAAGAASYAHPMLRFDGVEGRRGPTRYQVEAAVDLSAGSPTRVTRSRFAAQGRLRDLFEALAPRLPSALAARDALEGEVQLRGQAQGPAAALDATLEAELGPGALLGRAFDGGRAAGRIEQGARAVFDHAELRRGGGVVRGQGAVGFSAPFPWSIQASAAGLALADLGLPGRAWAGALSAEARAAGSVERPELDFTLRGEQVAVADVRLGAVDVEGALRGRELAVDARTPGVRLRATARVDGAQPFEARAEVDLPDALRFVPGGAPAGVRARVRGAGTAAGVLSDPLAAAAELRLEQVSLAYGDFQVDQVAPATLGARDGRLTLRDLALHGGSTQLTVSGTRERTGALALDARGAVDLRLLAPALPPTVAAPHGQVSLEAHVGGALSDPQLVGTGRVREAGFQLRDLPVQVSGAAGDLAFSQNKVLFDRVEALVNGGKAEFAGELELRRLLPSRARVEAALEEVPLRVPDWLPSVVSGRLQLEGGWDAMRLGGKLRVVRARYTQPISLGRRLLDVSAKRPTPRPYDRSGDWLALDVALAVDGDVRIDNDLVRGAVAGDLTLTGTLGSPGLVGTLTLRDGGRATFRGNEFAIRHAVLDFADRHQVRLTLDAQAEAQVNEYLVNLHLAGPYDDPTLQLTSQPALSQRDIVTLLSLGYTTRDTAAAGGTTGVATAAAAQALFSAAGLDEQLHRFVPRKLGDFNVRITSAYSEASGQVEPRAEFESKLLDDRFRLRYQAPLANSRGQRAQAEMRLTPRTSLQYQWDNENPDVSSGGDHGIDLKLRWEWTE